MTQGSIIQEAFVSGELAPAIWGRVSHPKYKLGASTMRNGFANFQGGYSSRPGTAFVGQCKQGSLAGGATLNNAGVTPVNTGPPRPIPFKFNSLQSLVLEFGDYYMRPVYQGSYVLEAAKTVTSVSNVGLFTTSGSHGYSIGDWVYDLGNTGFNALTWVVKTVPTGSTFTVTNLFGNVISSATASTGGTVARLYTATTPYAAVDLPYLKYTQSADEMSLTCWNQQTLTEYAPYDLFRISNNNWSFVQTVYTETITPPNNVVAVAHNSTTENTQYSYCVTAIDAITGSESVASEITYVKNNDISVNDGSNTVSWSPVAGAVGYNVYEATPLYNTGAILPQIGVPYAFVGTSIGTSFIDTNVTGDFTRTPPLHTNPFARKGITNINVTVPGSGYTQGTIGYTVSTSTGSGFSGTPIVLNGSLNAFYIANTGENYAVGDSITITGGGTAAHATGTYNFNSGSFTNGDTIILNGVTWTFVTGSPSGNQTQIQSGVPNNILATVTQLASDLNASTNASIGLATYGNSRTVILTIEYASPGTGGNSYTLAAGTYGGAVSGATLTGGTNVGGATVTLTLGPATGTYPGAVAYFQQRRAYASTQNNPDTYYMSQPGDYTNMDYSLPSIPDDAIVGTPWGQQVNGVQFMTPMPGGLVIFNGGGAWQLNGGSAGASISPANQFVQPQTQYGCSSTLQPIPINYHILFVRDIDGVVYDLLYNFYAQIYTGTDITVYSSHLFQGYKLVQWCYAEKPDKLVWAVRNDGALLSCTYLAEQSENGWARHDTNGLFLDICSIQEDPVNAVYVITQRLVSGSWLYYHERFDNRLWSSAENCFCVDAGLIYPMSFPAATLTPAAANGTSNITSTHVIFGGTGYTSPVATAVDSSNLGTGAIFSVTVSGGVITAVTPTASGQKYTPGATTIVITDTTGTGAAVSPIITNNVNFTASAAVFSAGNVGNVLRVGNGRATITAYNSTTSVTANITVPITAVIPNDPSHTPLPAASGSWSMSTPTTVVTNLNHLNGLTVTGTADGGVILPTVVTNGQITLQNPASSITVGLPFLPQLQALYLEMATPGNTLQTKRKNISSVGVRVHDTRGISVGSNQIDASTQQGQVNVPWKNMQEVKELNTNIPMGDFIPLHTGDYFINIGSEWNVKGQVAFQQNYPLPMNIDCIVSYCNGGDNPG